MPGSSGQPPPHSPLPYAAPHQAVAPTAGRPRPQQRDAAGERLQPLVDRLGSVLAEQVLKDAVVYRFRPEDLARGSARQVQPGAVTVTARGVEITLVPARSGY